MKKLLVRSLIVFLILAYFTAFTVSQTDAHASISKHAGTHNTLVRGILKEDANVRDTNASSCYLLIYYNGGGSQYCVTKLGYNGINTNLYNVTEFYTDCASWWVQQYTNGVGGREYYSGWGPAYVSFGEVTQVDVTSITVC